MTFSCGTCLAPKSSRFWLIGTCAWYFYHGIFMVIVVDFKFYNIGMLEYFYVYLWSEKTRLRTRSKATGLAFLKHLVFFVKACFFVWFVITLQSLFKLFECRNLSLLRMFSDLFDIIKMCAIFQSIPLLPYFLTDFFTFSLLNNVLI